MSTLNRVSQWWQALSVKMSKLAIIDFGSSQTRVMVDGHLVWDQPTCLALHTTSGDVVAVGHAALKLVGRSPAQVAIVFPVKNGLIADQGGASRYLKVIQSQITQPTLMSALIKMPTVCSLPHGLNSIEQHVFQNSLETAGWGVRNLPSALMMVNAGLHARYPTHSARCVLHIGDQVTQFGVFTQTTPLVARTWQWGGQRYTDHIQTMMRQKYSFEVGYQTAEHIKQTIGQVSPEFKEGGTRPQECKKMVVRGKHIISSAVSSVAIDGQEFMAGSNRLTLELVQELKAILQEVSPDVLSQAFETGIFLSGGGSLLPGLANYLEAVLACPVISSTAPSLQVIQATARWGWDAPDIL